MANSKTAHSRRLRGQTANASKKRRIADGTGKNKAFFLVDDQIEIVESALNSINPQSHTQALVELCKKHNESN